MELGVPRKYGTPFFSRYKYCFQYTAIAGIIESDIWGYKKINFFGLGLTRAGRGYPSIDSLKEISTFFSVTIDELLSGEKLLSIAEKENKSNMHNLCSILIGAIDLFHFLLIVLPLYPKSIKEYIASVNLFGYTETSAFNRIVYWVLFFLLMLIGAAEIIVTQLKIEKVYKLVIAFSMLLGIAACLLYTSPSPRD